MDKYEKKIRINQILSYINKGEYRDAQDVADTIDWRQEKSIRTLRLVSEVYKINRRYDDAFAVLSIAYYRNPEDPIKRKIVYDMSELAIKMGQINYAVQYMREFVRLAPKDPGKYILQYRLLKATDANETERIELLEEFKSKHFGDFDAKWAYELANLYHTTGQGEKCVECCNEISLWFVSSPLAIKALKLKRMHQELTYEEEQKVRAADEGQAGEEVIYQRKHRTDTAPVYMDTTPVIGDGYSSTDVEDRIPPTPEAAPAGYDPSRYGYGQSGMNTEHAMPPQGGSYQNMPPQSGAYQSAPSQNTPPRSMPSQGVQAQNPSGEFNIEVKKVDASTEPTIRMAERTSEPSILSRETTVMPTIQKTTPEIPSGSLSSVKAAPIKVEESTPAVSKKPEPVPVRQAESAASADTPDENRPEISVNLDKYSTMNLQQELKENMEKLQEETGELLREKEEKLPERVAEPDKDLTEIKAPDTKPQAVRPQETEPQGVRENKSPEEQTDDEIASKISRVPVPDEFKNIISQDYDGQLTLNVPEDAPEEDKQITGQMDIESVLAEWDKLQAEARERRIKAAKRKSLEQTNDIAKNLVELLPGYELPKPEEDEEAVKAENNRDQGTADDKTTVSDDKDAASAKETAAKREDVSEPPIEQISAEDIKIEEPVIEPVPDEPETELQNQDLSEGDEEDTEADSLGGGSIPKGKKNPLYVKDETIQLPSVFDTFLNIKGLAPQLKKAEEALSMEAARGNVLITGSEQAARLELIQAFARDISERSDKGSIRRATIDSEVFNTKDVMKSLKALSGNILVIERAGRLSDDAMNSLISVLSANEEKILVILEDSTSGARNLSEYSGFEKVFNITINIPTLSNDYLVEHARNYAREREYSLDEMAVLALYQRIDERQTSDHVVSSDEVEKIIDAAIKKASKKNLKHLGDLLVGKRYDDEDLTILREKDFETK